MLCLTSCNRSLSWLTWQLKTTQQSGICLYYVSYNQGVLNYNTLHNLNCCEQDQHEPLLTVTSGGRILHPEIQQPSSFEPISRKPRRARTSQLENEATQNHCSYFPSNAGSMGHSFGYLSRYRSNKYIYIYVYVIYHLCNFV